MAFLALLSDTNHSINIAETDRKVDRQAKRQIYSQIDRQLDR